MQWKCCTQQWTQDWKRSVFIPIPRKGNAKECSNYCTIALESTPVMSSALAGGFFTTSTPREALEHDRQSVQCKSNWMFTSRWGASDFSRSVKSIFFTFCSMFPSKTKEWGHPVSTVLHPAEASTPSWNLWRKLNPALSSVLVNKRCQSLSSMKAQTVSTY